jgi:hypothetical protein
VTDIEVAPVVPASTEAKIEVYSIPCHTLLARRQKGSPNVDIWKVPMKTRILPAILLIFSTCDLANAGPYGSGPTLLGNYKYCRRDYPNFFAEVDKIISDPSTTTFSQRLLDNKLGRQLRHFRDCLAIIDEMQAEEGLGGGARLTEAVENARKYIDTLVTQASPAPTPQNESQIKP